ncbi:hypothetical protein [Persicobacter diffluens]|uniref:hypothetical protein n=1 Tax=Persicobacter diffluens TaxID=981 RepID=UPI0030C72B0F
MIFEKPKFGLACFLLFPLLCWKKIEIENDCFFFPPCSKTRIESEFKAKIRSENLMNAEAIKDYFKRIAALLLKIIQNRFPFF